MKKNLDVKVEIKNILRGEDMKSHREILALFRSFGPMSLPIIAVGNEVISMGNHTPEEAVEALREKLGQSDGTREGGV